MLDPLEKALDMLELVGMVLDVLEWGKSLLLPLPLIRESFDNFVLNWGDIEMFLFFRKKVFFFFFNFFLNFFTVHD